MKRYLLALLVLLAGPAFAQQSAPDLAFDSIPDFLKLPPGMNFGEVPGVAVNARGNIFVFTRSNSANGPAYAPTAAQLLEFGPNGEFIGEVGKGDRKSTRLNSSHLGISYAVFCLKKKKT